MLKFTLLLIVSFFCLLKVGFAQVNLVANPSFEDTLNCSQFYKSPNAATPWFNPTGATPDYYRGNGGSCGTSAFNNSNGFQLPRTGISYIGIYTYLLPGTREYVEVKLLDSLKANEYYIVSWYVSLADKYKIAADGFGAYLSADSILMSGYSNFPFQPQIENSIGNTLSDTMNWVKISGIYHAIGGETFLTLGNFKNSSSTNIDTLQGGIYYNAYYYIDDVSIILDTGTGIESIKQSENISIFPNPCHLNKKLNISSFKCAEKITEVNIFSLYGSLLSKIENPSGNSIVITPSDYINSEGVYIIQVKTAKSIINRKLLLIK